MIDCASVDVDFPSRRWRGIIPNEMRFHDDSADSSQCGWESITQVKSGQFTASSRNRHRRFSTLKFIQKLKDDYKSGPVQQLKNLHTFKLWHNFCWAKLQKEKKKMTTTNFLNLGTLKRWQTQATLSLVVTDGRTLEPSLLVATFSTENHKLITLVFYIHFLCAIKAMLYFS